MQNELIRYASGEVTPTWRDREVAKQAKAVHDEVRLKALQADGALALAGHLMDGIMSLDQRRQSLTGNDPVADVMLTEIEAAAIRQLKNIQSKLYCRWGL